MKRRVRLTPELTVSSAIVTIGLAGMVALAGAGVLHLAGLASWCRVAPLLAGGAALTGVLPWSTRAAPGLRRAGLAAAVMLWVWTAVLVVSTIRCWTGGSPP